MKETAVIIAVATLAVLMLAGCYCLLVAKWDADEKNEERDLPYDPNKERKNL